MLARMAPAPNAEDGDDGVLLPAAPRAWRWIGLAAAVVVYALAVVTLGIGLLLAPVSFGVSVLALRRLPRPRGPLPWLGLLANAVLLMIPSYIGLIAVLRFLGD
jgi:hypothetical protein